MHVGNVETDIGSEGRDLVDATLTPAEVHEHA